MSSRVEGAIRITRDDGGYPATLLRLGEAAPGHLTIFGNTELLRTPSVALFCSVRIPAGALFEAFDLARELAGLGITIAGGFQSPIEREFLDYLLGGCAPVLLCPARGIEGLREFPEKLAVQGVQRLGTVEADQTDTVLLPKSSSSLRLLQHVRDEAHRFAITGHRARRQKARTRSPLEDVPGLGPKRRRELLRQFGGLQAVARAGVEDLERVKGISRQLAELNHGTLVLSSEKGQGTTATLTLPREEARPRRLQPTSDGRIWYGDYAAGKLGVYDPKAGTFEEWDLPGGAEARPYAMVVDAMDRVWVFETGPRGDPNTLVGFDPKTKRFVHSADVPSGGGTVRHLDYHEPTRAIWFGTDEYTIGVARLPR